MKLLFRTLVSLSLRALVASHRHKGAATTDVSLTPSVQRSINITRSGSRQSSQASAQNFTGSVRIEPLSSAHDPWRATGGRVTFEPGARTAWHTHPLGPTLIVTAGCGWVQRERGPVEEIRPGDVVWFAPGENHWHGAAPTTAMTHIAIQEKLNRKVVDWIEHVSEEEYQ